METARMLTILVLALAVMVCPSKVCEAVPMGTAWTYQGRLIDANEAADGLYDFQFKLFDDVNTVTGNQLGSTIYINDLDVIDGYFTVELDFGSGIFDGDVRWLEIGVRSVDSNDPNPFVTLSPRQEVTPTPYALYALHTRGVFVGDNTFVGREAGNSNTIGYKNTFVGNHAGYSNTLGNYNTFLGHYAGHSNKDAFDNTFLGYFAGYSNTMGLFNTSVGSHAGHFNTKGTNNTFVGNHAGYCNNTGNGNTFVGTQAGISNTIGGLNTFLGDGAGKCNNGGLYNVGLGARANYWNQEGSRNTIIGYDAGIGTSYHNKSGNVFIGYKAGFDETGSDKLYIANSEINPPLIYGEFDTGKIGVGTMSPAATVDVNGTLALENGPPINEVSTDGTLADNSDLAVPTEKAVKVYVDNKVSASGAGIVPIGTVVAWLKSFPNTPNLPGNFVECNGQELNDATSPYNGQTVPNLNGAGGGTQRFFRGSTTSGTTGGAETHSHGSDPADIAGGPSLRSRPAEANHLPSYYEVVWIMRVK